MIVPLILVAGVAIAILFVLMNRKGGVQEQEGFVKEVLSKDALVVDFGDGKATVVKMFGITPASDNEMMDDKIFELFEAHLLGMKIKVKPRRMDPGNIIIGSLYTSAGEYVNAMLVKQGLARWSASEAPGDSQLAEAQEVAKYTQQGVWNPAVVSLMQEKLKKQTESEEMSDEDFLNSGKQDGEED